MLVTQDFESGSLYGLEKFWAFHHYMGLPKGCGLQIDSKVSPLRGTASVSGFCFRATGAPTCLFARCSQS